MTAQRTRKILKALGYSAFFVVCFVVSLVVTFPYDRLTGYAESQMQNAMGMQVSIDGIRLTITGGVRLEGLALGPDLPRPGATAPASDTPYIRFDRAWVGVSFIGLLLGSTDADFEAEIANGTIEGEYVQDEAHTALKLKLVGVEARSIPWLGEKVGLPVNGTLTGDIEFDIPVGAATKSTGSVAFSFTGGVIGDGQAKLSLSSLMGYGSRRSSSSSDEGTVIQPIKLGPIALDTKVVNGELEIPRIEAKSTDAELSFEGQVKLGEPLSTTRVDTYLTVKLTEAYAQQDEQTETLVSLANTVGMRAKRDDGSFGFRISGTFLRGVSFRPSKRYTPPGGRGAASRARRAGRRRPAPRRAASRRRPRRSAGDEEGDDGEASPARRHPATRPPGSALAPRPAIAPPNQRAATPPTYPSGMRRQATPPPPTVIGGDTANDTAEEYVEEEEVEEVQEEQQQEQEVEEEGEYEEQGEQEEELEEEE